MLVPTRVTVGLVLALLLMVRVAVDLPVVAGAVKVTLTVHFLPAAMVPTHEPRSIVNCLAFVPPMLIALTVSGTLPVLVILRLLVLVLPRFCGPKVSVVASTAMVAATGLAVT